MKRLYLLRHAKSSWGDPGLDDSERPLAPRGHRAAPLVGAHMVRQGYRPALALCSPARRARETWSHVRGMLDGEIAEDIRSEVYLASPLELLFLVRAIENRHASAIVIGHNPGMAEFAHELAGGLTGAEKADIIGKFPTGALAVFDLAADGWQDLAADRSRLFEFVRPADLETIPDR